MSKLPKTKPTRPAKAKRVGNQSVRKGESYFPSGKKDNSCIVSP
jgi:hypothetical protein